VTTLLLLSNNLMFLPRIQQAAGSTVSIVRASNLDRLTELISEGNIDIVVADLEYDQDFWHKALQLFQENQNLNPKMIAYGPHEDTNSMELARSLGCDPVLAKGAFVNNLKNILKEA
jgi:AmiR/NasT family two-component response regulator